MQHEQNFKELNLFSENSGPLLHLLGVHILVVEDALDLQLLLNEILSYQGAKVSLAGNGEEALLQMSASSVGFDMILMDLQMPILDGYAATERIRAAGSQIPILALTAHALTGERERCLAAGFSDFMCKPINISMLIATIIYWTSARANVG